jgi:hypothetical protein
MEGVTEDYRADQVLEVDATSSNLFSLLRGFVKKIYIYIYKLSKESRHRHLRWAGTVFLGL